MFSAGSGDFSASFRLVPVKFQLFPVVGIIILGMWTYINSYEWRKESLPVDVLFEVFGYLSHVTIVQSFLSINKRLSRIIICEYLWHMDIGDSTMSLSMFNHICQNVLKL
jgi:hypothetical protein